MGFEGATPLAVLFPHFLSEKKMGCPSRHERQVKRLLRGKSQAGKGERQERKAAQTTHRTGEQAAGVKAFTKTERGKTRGPETKMQNAGAPAGKCAMKRAARFRQTSAKPADRLRAAGKNTAGRRQKKNHPPPRTTDKKKKQRQKESTKSKKTKPCLRARIRFQKFKNYSYFLVNPP